MANQLKMTEQKPQSLVQSQNTALALRDDPNGQNLLATEIYDRFNVMKTFGKEPESLTSITKIILRDLEEFPIDLIMRAIRRHSELSDEFFTVSDIINLIKRNGRPPIRESDVIAIRKKSGEERTTAEWRILTEWDQLRDEGWVQQGDPIKEQALLAENIRFRKTIKELERELERAWNEAKKVRANEGTDKLSISKEKKIQDTVVMMREAGESQSVIDEFLSSCKAC